MSNLAQICYLLAAAVVYLLTVSSSREDLQSAVDWYIKGCIVASLFAMYQLANATVHIPYPESILYSNTGHVIYRAYRINGMWRLNSTFNEASAMAGFLTTGLALQACAMVSQPLRLGTCLSFLLMLLAIIMSISSTGYVCLVLIVLLGVPLYVGYVMRRKAISPSTLVFGIVLLVGTTAFFTLSDTAGASFMKVINSVLLDKKNSESYREREDSHRSAMATFADTYYMGAGWGSIRSSGLTYMLFGTVGVIGAALFLGFYLSTFLPLFGRARPPSAAPGRGLFEQSLFGATILLGGLVIAGAEPTIPILWLLFGVATVGPPTADEIGSAMPIGLPRLAPMADSV
jgi:O-antigen ligase